MNQAKSSFWRTCLLGLLLFPAAAGAQTPQAALDQFADHLGYRFTVLSNIAGKSYAFADGSVDTRALLADWNSFQARQIPRLAELDRQNISYRLPVPGRTAAAPAARSA